MTKLEKMLRTVAAHAEAEQWGRAATVLERGTADEGARGHVARYLLDELEGDTESLLVAVNELLETEGGRA